MTTLPVLRLSHPSCPPRQGGAVLVVALLLLLVLTVLGVTVMNTSILQGLMSESYRSQTANLAVAENLLRQGELDVDEIVAIGVDERDYYIDLQAVPTDVFAAGLLDTVWPNPFVVEYMGEFEIPGESIAEGGGLDDSYIHIFRVSARSERTEEERAGLRIVQSLYVTIDGPTD